MSRPFSYNDENFTVIGNILFIHANIGGREYEQDETIFTIPQAIFIRMKNYNQQAALANDLTGGSSTVPVSCKENGDFVVHYEIKPVSSVRYLFTWFPLKDI